MKKKLLQLILFLFLALSAMSQSFDTGAITAVSVSKDFGRYSSVKFEQELRFNQHFSSFDRSKTTLGLNYSLIRNLLMAELDYNFIYLQKNDVFELRHRTSTGLSSQIEFNRFSADFKTRVQTTWRDETRGSYNFNPKFVWRNKLEMDYDIFGSPLKPFLSGELFCPLNGSNGFYLDGYRTTMGMKYRVSRHNSIEIQLMFDQEVQQANPKGVLYICLGWNYKI